MAAQQRMKVANEKAKKALELRGNVPKSTVIKESVSFNVGLIVIVYLLSLIFQRQGEDRYPVAPWLMALFVFVVCGSGEFKG